MIDAVCCLLDVGYVGDGVNCRYVGICAVNNGGCHPLAVCRETPSTAYHFYTCLLNNLLA